MPDVTVFVCLVCDYRCFAVQLAESHERRTGHDMREVSDD